MIKSRFSFGMMTFSLRIFNFRFSFWDKDPFLMKVETLFFEWLSNIVLDNEPRCGNGYFPHALFQIETCFIHMNSH